MEPKVGRIGFIWIPNKNFRFTLPAGLLVMVSILLVVVGVVVVDGVFIMWFQKNRTNKKKK